MNEALSYSCMRPEETAEVGIGSKKRRLRCVFTPHTLSY
jgi:hypothetical protein